MERFCIILFAVLLVIGCQTTKPAGQQEAGAQGQGQAAQAQQSQQSQSNAPEQQAAPGGAQSRSVSRGGAAVSPAKLVSAVSSGINNLFSKVKALVKKRPSGPAPRPKPARPAGPTISVGERLKSTLRSLNLASPDLLPTLAAAAILLGGGSLVLAAILTRRRRS